MFRIFFLGGYFLMLEKKFVGNLQKLKDLSIVENPLADNRLKKMAAQKTTKSVLDYIRQNCAKTADSSEERKEGKKGSRQSNSSGTGEAAELADRLMVMSISGSNPDVIATSLGKHSFLIHCSIFCIFLDLSDELSSFRI
jgi:hypothetical protein